MNAATRDETLIADLNAFMRAFSMRVDRHDGEHILHVPAFEPLPWRPAIKKRVLSRANPNAVFYEASTTAALAYFFAELKPKVFLDLGAQWGYFSALALNYQPCAIDTYAFEINPHVTIYLSNAIEAAHKRDRRGELILAGVSDTHEGERDIWISVTKMFESEPSKKDYRDPWWRRLKFALRGNNNRDAPLRVRVGITSIDHFCRERAIVPDIIKIDVDGYEAKVIPGALEILERAKPVVFLELHKKKFLERFGVSREQIAEQLFNLGYRALLLPDHHDNTSMATPAAAGSQLIGREATDMFIFYHPDRLAKTV